MSAFLVLYNYGNEPVDDSLLAGIEKLMRMDRPVVQRFHPMNNLSILASWHPGSETSFEVKQSLSTSSLVNDWPHGLRVGESLSTKPGSSEELFGEYLAHHRLSWSAESLEYHPDVYGRKVVFYSQFGQTIALASEPRFLLSLASVSAEPNMDMVRLRLLGLPTRGNQTLYQHIKIITPASILKVNGRGIQIKKNKPLKLSVNKKLGFDEWRDRIEAQLDTTIRDVSHPKTPDARRGVLLSGGLDSSGVAGFLRRHVEADEITAIMLQYPGMNCDESEYQDAVLNHCQITGHSFNPVPFVPERDMEVVTEKYQLPFIRVDPELQSAYRWSAENNITHMYSGAGGDELFASWVGSALCRFTTQGFSNGIQRANSMELNNLIKSLRPHAPKLMRAALRWRRTPDYVTFSSTDAFTAAYNAEESALFPSSRGMAQDRRDWFVNSGWMQVGKARMDAVAAEHGIQSVDPFVDSRLIELMLQVPEGMRFNDVDSRLLQRHSMAAVLPAEITSRRSKVNFDQRHAQDLMHPWVSEILNNMSLESAGLVNSAPLRVMHGEVREKLTKGINVSGLVVRLWIIIGTEVWWRTKISA